MSDAKSLIKMPHELEVPKIVKVLIYGQPGAGKSTLALSAPRAFHFDFDFGAHRVHPLHRKNYVQPKRWEEFVEVLDKGDLSQFDSLVFDTAGKMLDFASEFLIRQNSKLGTGGALNQRGYGARKALFNAIFHRIAMMGKKAIIFVAHDLEDKDGETKIVRPLVGASSGGDLIRELDLVGYVEMMGDRRTISFDPTEKHYGKNSCGMEKQIQIKPLDPKNPSDKNDFFEHVLTRCEARAKEGEEIAARYKDLMDAIRKEAVAIDGAERANEFMDRMRDAEHLWDSKFHAANMLRDRARELGIHIDGKSKRYVGAAPAPAETQEAKEAVAA